MANNYQVLAQNILDLIGGKENVSQLTHCITRLRFVLNDQSKIQKEAFDSLEGIIGTQFSGEQFQVIIGPSVSKVYDAVCQEGGLTVTEEKAPKEKLTIKNAFSKLISNLTACIYPVLPVFVASGMINMIVTVFGPAMLNVIPADSGLGTILTFAGNAGFYFLPVFLGYTTAKHLKVSPLMGILMGAILVHPTLISAAAEGTVFDLLGLPIRALDYSNSVLPIILSVWIMSYVERFLKKYVPEALELLLVPFGTIIIMIPISLGILAPLGNILGGYISTFLYFVKDLFGPVGVGIMTAVYVPLIMTGMHHTINMVALTNYLSLGYDDFVFTSFTPAFAGVLALALVFFLKSKKTANKSLGASGFFLQFVVGICEPALYGIILPTKHFLLALLAGGFVGGCYLGVMKVKIYAFLGSNFFCFLHYLGGDTMNFVHGLIGCAIGFAVTFAIGWVTYKEKE